MFVTTHSSTCRAVKCHCCFCSLSTEEAPLRWQMILIILDVNWWGRRTITQRAFYYKPWLPKLWTTEYCTCGLSSNQPLWKVTDFINLRKNFSTWEICSLFLRHEGKKQKDILHISHCSYFSSVLCFLNGLQQNHRGIIRRALILKKKTKLKPKPNCFMPYVRWAVELVRKEHISWRDTCSNFKRYWE